MVRKTREETLATRNALLDAALQVFRERGVAHTRLIDVAGRAGVTRGAIYWHFRDKAELFAAVCERGTLPVEALLAEASRTVQRDPLATVKQLALMALKQLAAHPDTQAMFDVIFHKCEFTDELAPVVAKNTPTAPPACRKCRRCSTRPSRPASCRRTPTPCSRPTACTPTWWG